MAAGGEPWGVRVGRASRRGMAERLRWQRERFASSGMDYLGAGGVLRVAARQRKRGEEPNELGRIARDLEGPEGDRLLERARTDPQAARLQDLVRQGRQAREAERAAGPRTGSRLQQLAAQLAGPALSGAAAGFRAVTDRVPAGAPRQIARTLPGGGALEHGLIAPAERRAESAAAARAAEASVGDLDQARLSFAERGGEMSFRDLLGAGIRQQLSGYDYIDAFTREMTGGRFGGDDIPGFTRSREIPVLRSVLEALTPFNAAITAGAAALGSPAAVVGLRAAAASSGSRSASLALRGVAGLAETGLTGTTFRGRLMREAAAEVAFMEVGYTADAAGLHPLVGVGAGFAGAGAAYYGPELGRGGARLFRGEAADIALEHEFGRPAQTVRGLLVPIGGGSTSVLDADDMDEAARVISELAGRGWTVSRPMDLRPGELPEGAEWMAPGGVALSGRHPDQLLVDGYARQGAEGVTTLYHATGSVTRGRRGEAPEFPPTELRPGTEGITFTHTRPEGIEREIGGDVLEVAARLDPEALPTLREFETSNYWNPFYVSRKLQEEGLLDEDAARAMHQEAVSAAQAEMEGLVASIRSDVGELSILRGFPGDFEDELDTIWREPLDRFLEDHVEQIRSPDPETDIEELHNRLDHEIRELARDAERLEASSYEGLTAYGRSHVNQGVSNVLDTAEQLRDQLVIKHARRDMLPAIGEHVPAFRFREYGAPPRQLTPEERAAAEAQLDSELAPLTIEEKTNISPANRVRVAERLNRYAEIVEGITGGRGFAIGILDRSLIRNTAAEAEASLLRLGWVRAAGDEVRVWNLDRDLVEASASDLLEGILGRGQTARLLVAQTGQVREISAGMWGAAAQRSARGALRLPVTEHRRPVMPMHLERYLDQPGARMEPAPQLGQRGALQEGLEGFGATARAVTEGPLEEQAALVDAPRAPAAAADVPEGQTDLFGAEAEPPPMVLPEEVLEEPPLAGADPSAPAGDPAGAPLAVPVAERPAGESAVPLGGERGELPRAEITLDEERFQFRVELSEARVQNIMRDFDPNRFEPLVVWRDPDGGATYLLSGHHRYEATRRLGIDRLPVRYIDAQTAEEAEAYARWLAAISNMESQRPDFAGRLNSWRFGREAGRSIEEIAASTTSKPNEVAWALSIGRLGDQVVNIVNLNEAWIPVARRYAGLLDRTPEHAREAFARQVGAEFLKLARDAEVIPRATAVEKSLQEVTELIERQPGIFDQVEDTLFGAEMVGIFGKVREAATLRSQLERAVAAMKARVKVVEEMAELAGREQSEDVQAIVRLGKEEQQRLEMQIEDVAAEIVRRGAVIAARSQGEDIRIVDATVAPARPAEPEPAAAPEPEPVQSAPETGQPEAVRPDPETEARTLEETEEAWEILGQEVEEPRTPLEEGVAAAGQDPATARPPDPSATTSADEPPPPDQVELPELPSTDRPDDAKGALEPRPDPLDESPRARAVFEDLARRIGIPVPPDGSLNLYAGIPDGDVLSAWRVGRRTGWRIIPQVADDSRVQIGEPLRTLSGRLRAVDRRTRMVTRAVEELLPEGVGQRTPNGELRIDPDLNPEIRQLWYALDNQAAVRAGLMEVPEGYRDFYWAVLKLRDWEEDFSFSVRSLEQAFSGIPGSGITEFRGVEDYFSRMYRQVYVDPLPGVGRGSTRLPRADFKKHRTPTSFREATTQVFSDQEGRRFRLEPLSWNPAVQAQHRSEAGWAYRQQLLHLKALLQAGEAEVRGTVVPNGKITPQGVPVMRGFVVDEKIGRKLELEYATRGGLSIWRGGVKLAQLTKRSVISFSPFQHRDILHRLWGFSVTAPLVRGDPVATAAAVPRVMRTTMRAFRAQVDPAQRERTRLALTSTAPVNPRGDVSPAMAFGEGGIIVGDISLRPEDIEDRLSMWAGETIEAVNEGGADSLLERAGGLAREKVVERVGSFMRAVEDGLFEQVYGITALHLLEHVVAPYVDGHQFYRRLPAGQRAGVMGGMVNRMMSSVGNWDTVILDPRVRDVFDVLPFSRNEFESGAASALGVLPGSKQAVFWSTNALNYLAWTLILANVIHYATTGELLPRDRYNPLDRNPFQESPAPIDFPVQFRSTFATPDIPVLARSGENLQLDLLIQQDFAFRLLDGADDFLLSRAGPFVRVAYDQATGRDFYGNEIQSAQQRLANIAQTVAPIPAQNLAQLASPGLLNEGETTVGRGGLGLQAAGVNVRSPGARELRERYPNEAERPERITRELERRDEVGAARGSAYAQRRVDQRTIRAEERAALDLQVQLLRDGKQTGRQFRERYNAVRREHAQLRAGNNRAYERYYDFGEEPTDPLELAVFRHYAIYDEMEEEGRPDDWDEITRRQEALYQSLTVAERAHLEEVLGRNLRDPDLSPEERDLILTRNSLRATGWWETDEEAWGMLRLAIAQSGVQDPALQQLMQSDTYHGWRRGMEHQVQGALETLGVGSGLAQHEASELVDGLPVVKAFQSARAEIRSRWVVENPCLADRALYYGYLGGVAAEMEQYLAARQLAAPCGAP